MRRTLLLVLCSLLSYFVEAQTYKVWNKKEETQLSNRALERVTVPNKYQVFGLDLDALEEALTTAPARNSIQGRNSNLIIEFPLDNGKTERFRIQKTAVMHPALEAKYPQIQSFMGQSIDNPLNKIYFTSTPKGFRGLITGEKTVYIDPYAKGDSENYIVYDRKLLSRDAEETFKCHVEDVINQQTISDFENSDFTGRNVNDGFLRTYELAVACTSEYTSYHDDGDNSNGDAKADALAAIVVTVARVNSVFERDVAITFQLVPNNNLLIYENGFTVGGDPEPYDNYDGGQMLGVNTGNINGLIGSAAYDIGHVFSTGGGGIAGTSPCNDGGGKGRGVTGIVTPEFDPFDIDYVSHEIGHQFSASHTFYNPCFGSPASTPYETGSASTIMGYAGICTPNVQDNSDAYFHLISLFQMNNSILSDTCEDQASLAGTNPNAPTAVSPGNFTIPQSTPFILTASSNTPDAGDVYTYCWEELDTGIYDDTGFPQPPVATNQRGPMFRSLFPTTDPSRTFPNLEAIINNEDPTWETLPSVTRDMRFFVTVRDNNPAGGQSQRAVSTVTVNAGAGPFLVSSPNTGSEIWYAGATETVTWDVNGTNNGTYSTTVNILLSTDGGYTYPITLASGVANDGSQNITVPNNIGTTNRIKIEAASNIFFDISNQDFEIKAGTFEITATQDTESVCQPNNAVFNLNYAPAPGFSENVTFSALNAPAGANINFSPASTSTTTPFTMTVSNTAAITPGNYTITVQGQSTSATETYDVLLNVFDNTIEDVVLTSPADGATNQTSVLVFQWAPLVSASNYDIEIASDPTFTTVVESANVQNDITYMATSLSPGTIYYWRVRPNNTCLSGQFSESYVFQTANDVCITYDNEYFENGDNTWDTGSNNAVSARVDVPDDIIVTDVSFYMLATHSDVGDIKMQFSSPTGRFAEVYNRDCPNGSNFDVTFTDAGSTISCSGTPQVSGNVLPSQLFSRFQGDSGQGTWVLLATDREADTQGGTFQEFSVTICGELQIVNDVTLDVNTGITVDQGNGITFSATELSASQPSSTATQIIYTLTELPSEGTLELNSTPLAIGQTFTQEDINLGRISYSHAGASSDPDSFSFSVQGQNNALLGGQSVAISVNASVPPPTGTSPQEFCASANATLDDVVVNTTNGAASIVWYDAPTGGTVLPGTTPLVDGTVYHAAQMIGAAESNTRLAITIVIIPDDPSFSYDASTYCSNDIDPTPTISGTSGGTFSSAPSGLVIDSGSGVIDLDASAANTYTITYTLTGTCPASTTFDVTIQPAEDSSFGYAITNLCTNNTIISPTVTGLPGGMFSSVPAGLALNPTSGDIDPASSTVGSYTVSYTTSGTCATTTNVAVSVTAADDASFSYADTDYCSTGIDPTPTITGLTGGTFSSTTGLIISSGTGAIDLDTSTAGTYTVTYTTNGACPASATFDVTITTTPGAPAVNPAQSFCATANPTIADLVATGSNVQWYASPFPFDTNVLDPTTPLVDGNNYYGTQTVNGCESIARTIVSVTLNPDDDASFNYASATYCSTDVDPTPTITGLAGGTFSSTPGLTIDGGTGAVDLDVSTPGTYTVTYTTAGACPNSATFDITINAPPAAPTVNTPQTFCATAVPTIADLVATGSNIQWYASPFPFDTNVLDPTTALVDGSTYYGTQTVDGCESTARSAVSVTLTPDEDASFNYAPAAYCVTDADPTPTITGVTGGTFSSTPGLTIDGGTGAIDLDVSTPGTYTVTYTTAGTCPGNATFDVTINATPSAPTVDAMQEFCAATVPTIANLVATGSNIQWYASPFPFDTNVLDPTTALVDGNTYYATQTVDGCESTSRSAATVTLTPDEDASFNYASATYCATDADPTPTITGVTGGTFSSTAGLMIDGGTGAIDLDASTPGTYTVTYMTTGTCPGSATFDVTINATPSAPTAGAQEFCATTNPTVADLVATGSNLQWYNVATGGTPLLATTALLVQTYYVSQTVDGCESARTAVVVTLTPDDDASFNYASATYCANDTDPTPTITGVAGGTFSSTVGLTIDSGTGTIDLDTSTPATYTVTYTTAGTCPGVSTFDVTIQPAEDSSFGYAITNLCTNNTIISPTITGLPGGSFTSVPAGLALNPTSGDIDPASSAVGSYTVSYTTSGTCATTTNVAVSITAADDASFSYAATDYCSTGIDPTPTITGLTGGSFSSAAGLSINTATGAIDLDASTAGTYTVTYTTNGVCPSFATFDISITTTPGAPTASPSQEFCATDNPTLADIVITGSNIQWYASPFPFDTNVLDPTTALVDGSNYYATQSVNGCESIARTIVSVTLNPDEDASFSYASATYCVTDADPTPTITGVTGGTFSSTTGLTIDGGTGAIDLDASTPGTYTVTYTTAGTCTGSATFDVTINATPSAPTVNAIQDFCATAAPTVTDLVATGSNIQWYASPFPFDTNVLDPTTALVDGNTYYATQTVDGCESTTRSAVTVTLTPDEDASFSYASAAYCVTDADPTPTITGVTGGTFSSTTGLTIDGGTGAIDLDVSTPGTYTVTYTTAGTCPGSSTFDVTINTTPSAPTVDAMQEFCATAAPTIADLVATGSNIQWYASPFPFDTNVLDPTTALVDGNTYYATQTVDGCESTTRSAVTVTLTPDEDASFSYASATYCATDADPTPTITGVTGGTFSSTAGLMIDGGTGAIDLDASTPGTYTVTYTTAGTCPGSATFDVTINATPSAPTAAAIQDFCVSANPTVADLAATGTNLQWYDVATGGTALASTTTLAAQIYYVSQTVDGCESARTAVTVTLTPDEDASFSYASATYCAEDADPTPTITGVTGGTFSSTTGLMIDGGTGVIDLDASTPGTYTVTYTTAGTCPGSTTFDVTINATPSAPTAAAIQDFCATANPTVADLAATGTNLQWYDMATGGTALAGTTALLAQTYYVSQTVDGCESARTAVTVTLTPDEDASFSYASATYCAADADPTPTITGVTGGTFSSTAGLMIDGGTGAIDLDASTPGTYTVTYVTSGTCPGSTTFDVTINATPESPIAAAIQEFCATDNPTIADIVVIGSNVQWYATPLPSDTTVLDPTTPLVNGNNYYATQTVNGCQSTARTIVSVTLNPDEDASFSYATAAYCATDADPTPTITGITGGTFTSTAGLTIDGGTGAIDLDASTPGIYTVTYTTNGTCPGSATFDVTINATPTAPTVDAIQEFCATAAPTIADLVATGSNIQWYASPFPFDTTVLDPTTALVDGNTYYATQTIDGCESTTRSAVTVTLTPDEDASFSYASTAYCVTEADPTPTITGIAGGIFSSTTGLIIDGGTGAIDLSASTPGTYTVTYTTAGTCPGSATFDVTINTTPPAPTVDATQEFCATPVPTIADLVATGSNIQWYASPFPFDTNVLDPTTALVNGNTYYGTQTVDGCESTTRSAVTVTVYAITPAPTAQNQDFCSADNPTVGDLVATGTNLLWYDMATGGTPLTSTDPLVSQTYYVSQTENGCESDRTAVVVTVNTTPGQPTATGAQAFCTADNPTVADLVATGDNIQWYSSPFATVPLASTDPLSNGNYYATQTVNGCESVGRAIVTVTVNTTPLAPTANDQDFCSSDNATVGDLLATGSNILWYDVATGGTPLSLTDVLTSQTYYVTQTTNNCESARTAITVTVTTTPNAPTASDQGFCISDGATVADLVASGTNLQWYDVASGGNPLAPTTALIAQTYYVSDSNGACESPRTAVAVTLTTDDDASFSYASATYCSNEVDPTPTITGVAGGMFSSSAGISIDAGTGVIDLDASTPGTYTITYATTGTCPGSSTFDVTINATPLEPVASNQEFCASASPTVSDLVATGSNIQWYDVAIGGVSLAGSTSLIAQTYYVSQTVDGCESDRTAVVVTLTADDDAGFAYASSTYCSTETDPTPMITGTPGGTFGSLPSGLSIDTNSGIIDLSASTPGTYTVTYTTNGTCPSSSDVMVTITATEDASFGYTSTSLCVNDLPIIPTITGVMGGGFTSVPSTGLALNPTTGEIIPGSSTPGSYVVTYTTTGTCSGSSSVGITIDPAEDASFSYSASAYCQAENDPTPTITGLTGGTFSSTTGLIIDPASGQIDLDASTIGTYTVTYMTAGSCVGSSTFEVTVNANDDASFMYASSTYCASDVDPTPTITGVAGGMFSSTPGLSIDPATGAIDLDASAAGVYTVTYTTSGVCSDSSTFDVTIFATPGAPAANNQEFCLSAAPTVADLVATGSNLQWYDMASGGTALTGTDALIAQTYYVSQTVDGCESARTAVVVTLTADEDASFSYSAAIFCSTEMDPSPTITGIAGGTFSADVALAIDTNTGVIDLDASTPGTYTITYTTTGTCPGMATFDVTIVDTPAIPVADALQAFCAADMPTVADLVATGSNIQWYASATDTNPLPPTALLNNGDYFVTQSIGNCESDRGMVEVIINPTTANLTFATNIDGAGFTPDVDATLYMFAGGSLELGFADTFAGTVNWVLPGGATATGQTLLISNNVDNSNSGMYTATVTFANGCPVASMSYKFTLNVTDLVKVAPKAYLQAAMFNSPDGLMMDDLRTNGYLPIISPYGDNIIADNMLFNFTGNDAIVDWVNVELRDATDNSIVIASQSALLQRDGDIIDDEGNLELTFLVPVANYHVVIKHRNHLGIMSASALPLSGMPTVVDFTDNSTPTFGVNAQTTFGMPTGTFGMWAGDANGDGRIIFLNAGAESIAVKGDVLNAPGNIFNSVFFTPDGYYNTDVNMDAMVVFLNAGNEMILIRDNILAHPDNMFNSVFYIISAQLP